MGTVATMIEDGEGVDPLTAYGPLAAAPSRLPAGVVRCTDMAWRIADILRLAGVIEQ